MMIGAISAILKTDRRDNCVQYNHGEWSSRLMQSETVICAFRLILKIDRHDQCDQYIHGLAQSATHSSLTSHTYSPPSLLYANAFSIMQMF